MARVIHMDGDYFFDVGTIPIRVLMAQHNAGEDIYHSHSFYEFVYIDSGFSTHFYNNTTTLLTPGDIFGIRPGDTHGYINPKNTVLYNCIFLGEAIEEELGALKKLPGVSEILDPSSPPVWQRIRLDPISQKEAVGYLKRMKREGEDRSTGWEIKLKGLLMEFLVVFSRAYLDRYKHEEVGEYRYTQYIYGALEYIEAHYTWGISVEEIANHIGLSTDYFSRMFKGFTGLSPTEYIKNVRLAKAVELLMQPGVPIAHVAMEVGFDDPGYFSKQFKQVLGVSPSRFQKENISSYTGK